MDDSDNSAKFELPDEKRSVEIIEKILRQSGLKYRRVRPGEKGGFYYRDKLGRRVRFEGNIFVKRLELMKRLESERENDRRKKHEDNR